MIDTTDLDAQIAALQEQKQARIEQAAQALRRADKEAERVLVGGTPTKKAKVISREDVPEAPKQPLFSSANRNTNANAKSTDKTPTPGVEPPRASSMAARIAARQQSGSRGDKGPSVEVNRSSSFGDRVNNVRGPDSGTNASTVGGKTNTTTTLGTGNRTSIATLGNRTDATHRGTMTLADRTNTNRASAAFAADELEIVRTGTERGEDLTLDVDLPLGPGEFGLDAEGENEWRHVEPNSAIRLSKRFLPHEDLQNFLHGRYFIRPSQLYSLIRLSRDGATYDVPVDGDWVTIAVVAERSDIRISGTKEGPGASDDEEGDEPNPFGKDNHNGKGKKDVKNSKRKRAPRKYVNLKLVALPPRSKSLGGTAAGGDAILQLLLFEADSIVRHENQEGAVTRTYRGGSGGAYERWCNLSVGSVIAILNPRVLRPLKSGLGSPHPLTLPLALNPSSDGAIIHIGQAMDIGICTALQRDGTRCKTWVDTRQSAVCEYHVHAAVKRNRSTRAEFASASTSYELSARGKGDSNQAKGSGRPWASNKKGNWGLLPNNGGAAPSRREDSDGGATYIVGTGLARVGSSDRLPAFGDAHLGERMGRSQAEKRKRKHEEAEAEAALQRMFEKSGDDASPGARYLSAVGKGPSPSVKEEGGRTRSTFSAAAIQRIGYDPSGYRSEDRLRKSAAIASLKGAGKPFKLSRSGPKKLSSVINPTLLKSSVTPEEAGGDDVMIDLE